MKFKLIKCICLICMIVVLNCNDKNAICETIKQNTIKEGAVQRFRDTHSFIIKFKNLIYEENSKQIKIPIFQGDMGDVTYNEFLNYCHTNNLLEKKYTESGFIIKTDKGKLTKTFREFLNFYKNNIFKNADISKPTKLKSDGGALDIFYDFESNGIPFVLHINISTDKSEVNADLIKSIFDINLDENIKIPMFQYRFWSNYTSKEL